MIFYFVAFVVFCKSTHSKPVQAVLVLQLHVFKHNAALALITLDLKREKIKHLLFKVIKLIYLYHSYQETVFLAS